MGTWKHGPLRRIMSVALFSPCGTTSTALASYCSCEDPAVTPGHGSNRGPTPRAPVQSPARTETHGRTAYVYTRKSHIVMPLTVWNNSKIYLRDKIMITWQIFAIYIKYLSTHLKVRLYFKIYLRVHMYEISPITSRSINLACAWWCMQQYKTI